MSSLTVLIGENGSGKSTIIECLEILHKAGEANFMQQLYDIHRGMPGLLRKGASALELGVVVEDDAGQQPRIEYSFVLAQQGAGAVVKSELLLVGPMNKGDKPQVALRRTTSRVEGFNERGDSLVIGGGTRGIDPEQLTISRFGAPPPHKAFERLLVVLHGIEVHLHFNTVAAWAARSYRLSLGMRESLLFQPAKRLHLLGFNLANAWSELKNRSSEHWDETMALVRLGIGEVSDSVNVEPDAGGGNIAVSLRLKGLNEPIPAANLSDGQLSWLAFVAMARLNENRSLLAIDEPELHLHPSLLGRVVSMLTSLDSGAPVLLSTHSDRVLTLLDEPEDAVRVCSLVGSKAVVSRIDKEELPKWLESFGDLGQLRESGYLPRVLKTPEVAE